VCAQESETDIYVTGDNFRLVFSKSKGTLTQWDCNGIALIEQGPKLNLWRAPTDNDIHIQKNWRKFGLDRLVHRIAEVTFKEAGNTALQIHVAGNLGAYSVYPPFDCQYIYTIYGTGDIIIRTKLTPRVKELPHLPRIGLQLVMPAGFDRMQWFGRGPHENYCDRKESARVGVYAGTVQEQYLPYIFPQENGNKSDVRWAAFTNLRGDGLLAVGMPLLEVSAHHYTTEDLTRARHTFELQRRNQTIVNLDYKVGGLGSNSCGPGPLTQYQLPPVETTFAMRLVPFSCAARCPMSLSKRRLEVVG
jgi:hypothetical protein